MTKTEALYYILAVIIITLLAYLYTSVVEAPTHDDTASTVATS